MPRPLGSKNKVTNDVKERLKELIDHTVESLDISTMNVNQKLKLLQLSLQYCIPKLTSIDTKIDNSEYDVPLFIDIHDRNENGDWVVERMETKMPANVIHENRHKWS